MKSVYLVLVALASLGIGAIATALSASESWFILLMAILIFLLSGFIIYLRYYRYGLNDPFLLFTAFFALYNGPFLVQVAWSLPKGLSPSPMFPIRFSPNVYSEAAFASFLAAVGLFFSAIFISLTWKKARNAVKGVQSRVFTPWIGISVFFMGLIMCFLNYQRIGGFMYALSLPRGVRLELLSETPHNLPYAPLVFVGLAWIWLDYARKRLQGFWAWGLLGLWGMIVLIQGGRRFLVYAVLIAFATYAAVRYPKVKIKLKFVVALIAILMFSFFFAHIRWLIPDTMFGRISVGEAIERIKENVSLAWFLPGTNEFAGPYFTLLYSIAYPWPKDAPLFGKSYLQAIPNLLPRSLYPGHKPPPLGDALAIFIHQTYMPWRESAIGWGYSPVAEAFNNFKLWGIPLVFFTIGLLWEWVARFRYKNWVGILLYALLIPQTINLNRTTMAWSFQEAVYFAGVLFFVLVVRSVLLGPCLVRLKGIN